MISKTNLNLIIDEIASKISSIHTIDEAKELSQKISKITEFDRLIFSDENLFSLEDNFDFQKSKNVKTKAMYSEYEELLSVLPNHIVIKNFYSSSVELDTDLMTVFELYGLTEDTGEVIENIVLNSDGMFLLKELFEINHVHCNESAIPHTAIDAFSNEESTLCHLIDNGYSLSKDFTHYACLVSEYDDVPENEVSFIKKIPSGKPTIEALERVPVTISNDLKLARKLFLHNKREDYTSFPDFTQGCVFLDGIDKGVAARFDANRDSEKLRYYDFTWQGDLDISSEEMIELPRFINCSCLSSLSLNNVKVRVGSLFRVAKLLATSEDSKLIFLYDPEVKERDEEYLQFIDGNVILRFSESSSINSECYNFDTYLLNHSRIVFDLKLASKPVEMFPSVIERLTTSKKQIHIEVNDGSVFIPTSNYDCLEKIGILKSSSDSRFYLKFEYDAEAGELSNEISKGIHLRSDSNGVTFGCSCYNRLTLFKASEFKTKHPVYVQDHVNKSVPLCIPLESSEQVFLDMDKIKTLRVDVSVLTTSKEKSEVKGAERAEKFIKK